MFIRELQIEIKIIFFFAMNTKKKFIVCSNVTKSGANMRDLRARPKMKFLSALTRTFSKFLLTHQKLFFKLRIRKENSIISKNPF